MGKGYEKNPTYDYIVVGTGPASSVATKKLSDSHRNSVLTLELEVILVTIS